MERIQKILEHTDYQKYVKKNRKSEKHRKFCRHTLPHFADVARIAYIYNLEQHLGFSKEIIYAAALLHDIGKWQQYKRGIPHNEASCQLAKKILNDCAFSKEESTLILDSILTHRHYEGDKQSLNFLLYFGDKRSRLCFDCKAEKDCNWTSAMKNHTLWY